MKKLLLTFLLSLCVFGAAPAVDAADGCKLIGLIDRIFVFVKAKAGEIVAEVIRPFHGNTDLRIDQSRTRKDAGTSGYLASGQNL